MVRATRHGIGRTSHEWTSTISAVPGIAASRPTSAMRAVTGQRSIGSIRPNNAASRITCSQLSRPMIVK